MPKSSKSTLRLLSHKLRGISRSWVVAINRRTRAFLARRPHRSFRMTDKRDVRRSLRLPGYFAFTAFVNKTLWKHRKVFLWLAAAYAVLMTVLVGLGSQDTFVTLSTTLQETGSELFKGSLGEVGKAALIFVSIGATGLAATPTEAQQVYAAILGLLIWLTTVWLLRSLLAGHKVKMRDGLYSAGSPIVSTFLVAFVLVVQLIPAGIALLGYSAASASGLFNGGVEAMLFWVVALLLTVLSLYWITSTFFALIIVTLPGMYPGRALRAAGDMVVSRRLRILLRILWMFLSVIVTGALVLIPIILLSIGLSNLWPWMQNIPLVPIALMIFGVMAFIWSASYIYLLYRKVVDDDAQPA
jgi:hypothetical protein